MAKKKLKLKKKNGNVVDLTVGTVKGVLDKAGFTGKHLISTTTGVMKEAGKLASSGIITAVNLEKAIIRGVHNTNELVMNNTKKITKRVLK